MRACILALVAFLILAPAQAAAEAGQALVIGNSAYREPVPALPNPATDATTVAAKLRARGFAVTVLRDADLAAMRAALSAWSTAAMQRGPSASHLFYYSGHGVQIRGGNYLLPTNIDAASADAVARTALPLSEVTDQVRRMPSRVNFIILDACRDNPFEQSGEGLAAIPPIDNAFIAFSTSPGMTANDGDGRNSRFTAALALAMNDEMASAQDVFRRARDYVIRTSGGAQRPDYIDTVAVVGGDPWTALPFGVRRPMGTAQITPRTPPLVLRANGPMGDEAFAAVRGAATTLRAEPARAGDAALIARFSRALAHAVDVGEQNAEVAPDYMSETYPGLISTILGASENWSAYDLAVFLAHAAHATYQFQMLAEAGLPAYFRRYDNRPDLGNVSPGDGMRYRGRGLMQVSGRSRYAALSLVLGANIVDDPDALTRDQALSARASALVFEPARRALTGDPRADIIASTRTLTGATRDAGLRGQYLYRLLDALHPTPPRATAPGPATP